MAINFEYRTDEITPSVYAELSVREKIRHHRICAAEARHDAGAMWRDGAPVGPDQLPQKWHDGIAKAKRHEAEAKRLRESLAGKFEG